MSKEKPTRAAVEARPTANSGDVFADRTVWQSYSETQRLPSGDKRYRVNPSEKFYVVQLIGSWVNVSESAERTITYRNRAKWVTFESREYQLRPADKLKPFVARFIQGGCYAYVGGKQVDTIKQLNKLIEQPFIYIASSAALRIFNGIAKSKWSGKGSTED